MKLLSSTGGQTIDDGGSSQVFFVGGGIWNLYVTGTPSTGTLTLKWCRKSDGTFVDYVYDKSGAATTFTISATEVASSSKGYHATIIDHGMFFKLVDDGVGTGTSWQIDVNGSHVQAVPAS
jgi:hypothetical protein